MQSQPNFLVVIFHPVYDNRDAVVGSRGRVYATAETLGWADCLCNRIAEDYYENCGDGRVEVRVNDTRWSRPSRPVRSLEEQYADEIPF
jgi:hypothetical protein